MLKKKKTEQNRMQWQTILSPQEIKQNWLSCAVPSFCTFQKPDSQQEAGASASIQCPFPAQEMSKLFIEPEPVSSTTFPTLRTSLSFNPR